MANNCLVTRLKNIVNNDNLPFLECVQIKLVGQSNAAYNKVIIPNAVLVSGVLYNNESYASVVANAGDTLVLRDYYVKTGDTVKIKCFYSNVTHLEFHDSSFIRLLDEFASFRILENIYIRFTKIYGNIESFVEKMIRVRGGSFTIGANFKTTQIKLNGQLNMFDGLISIVVENDSAIIKNSSNETMATYTISTNTWEYSS